MARTPKAEYLLCRVEVGLHNISIDSIDTMTLGNSSCLYFTNWNTNTNEQDSSKPITFVTPCVSNFATIFSSPLCINQICIRLLGESLSSCDTDTQVKWQGGVAPYTLMWGVFANKVCSSGSWHRLQHPVGQFGHHYGASSSSIGYLSVFGNCD